MERLICCAVLLLVGCSASERIAVETNSIGERAAEIHRLAIRIGEQSDQPEVCADAASIAVEAVAIGKGTQAIHASLPGVTDRTPWWADLLKWLAIAAVGAAAVWLVHATGVGTAIRIAIGWIPRRKVQEAELAIAALDESKPEGLREVIAARRAADPVFDEAVRKAQAAVQSPQKETDA
jgi:hypothetical protein